ncbi:MAG: ABC transporter substrate-binding protein, partial [Erysipelothrix sp.]|nr:ABC transporter substrate-binding protein [Erysipelothrix sp.]
VGVSSPSDIETAASQLVKKVDALFNITDNMVVSATSQVVNVANQANIPVFASEVGQFDQGILATESIDYFDLGLMAGEMIYNVLTSEVSIKDLDHMVSEDTVLYFNLDVAEKLGIDMPESIKSRLK